MSRIEIYAIGTNGEVRDYGEAHNPHACASHIWMVLGEKYLGDRFASMNRQDELWRLVNGPLTEDEKIALAFTFDRVWVRREHCAKLADVLYRFWKQHHVVPGNEWPGKAQISPTLLEVSVLLHQVSSSESIRGVCFNQTSVNNNPWRIPDESNQDESRAYNFDQDTVSDPRPPWELFDGLRDTSLMS